MQTENSGTIVLSPEDAQRAVEMEILGFNSNDCGELVGEVYLAIDVVRQGFKVTPRWATQLDILGTSVVVRMVINELLKTAGDTTQAAQVVYGAGRMVKLHAAQNRKGEEYSTQDCCTLVWNVIHAMRNAGVVTLWKPNGSHSGVFCSWTKEFSRKLTRMGLRRLSTALQPMLCQPTDHGVNSPGGMLMPQLRKTVSGKSGFRSGTRIYQVLNKLQSTQWRVNTQVLQVLEQYMDQEEFKKDLELTHEISLQTAKNLNDKPFYHAWFIDWRGRYYTRVSHLSPQGNDMDRGLLCFANPRQLSEEGFYWLKVHFANLWYTDKVSFDERVKWVDENWEDLKDRVETDSNSKPMWFQGWQKGADSLQRLAAFMAMCDAHDTGMCSIAVQLDGTCNGPQHCAMMTHDLSLAKLVNVVGNVRGDLYTAVAERVNSNWNNDLLRIRDMNCWLEEPHIATAYQQWVALHHKVLCSRNIAKVPVMIGGYGGTIQGLSDKFMGGGSWDGFEKDHKVNGFPLVEADSPIYEQLSTVPRQWQVKFAMALAMDYMTALNETAQGAKLVTDMCRACTKEANAADEFLEWTTPSGLICKQQVYKTEPVQLEAAKGFQYESFGRINLQFQTQVVNKQSMLTGASPNFVHSMDASHMTYVVDSMSSGDLHMIHDSFGCHPNDADEMVHHVRAGMMETHKHGTLAQLCAAWKVDYIDLKQFESSAVLSAANIVA